MGAERSVLNQFRRYFWQPPRAHGEVIEDRTVSFLELFYDLVYVVVVAQAAHHLAGHVSWQGAADFAIVFGLIWIGWLNGTLYHDLHSRGDGRSRTLIFAQMALLALLAVFTGDAFGEDGRAFAIVYALFLALLTWMWWVVRREDQRAGRHERFGWVTNRYVAAMAGATALFAISAFVGEAARRWLWIVLVVGWIVGMWSFAVLRPSSEEEIASLTTASESLIERFGLFTIIVLGEVVVGVVEGMSESEDTAIAITTGMIALSIGFAFWWSYFDFVGGRKVRTVGAAFTRWMLGHLPVTGAIAAAGAAMVGIVEHAGDARTPAPNAWLLSGSVAVGLFGLVWITGSLEDARRLPHVYRPLTGLLVLAALVSLLLAWIQPVPWLFVLLVSLCLAFVWLLSVVRWFGIDDGEAVPGTIE